MGIITFSGIEWMFACKIIRETLEIDDILRKHKKTLYPNETREWTEKALKELEAAADRAKIWIAWVQGQYGLFTIETRNKSPPQKMLCDNEQIILFAPKNVSLRASVETLFGIANACCNAMGIHDVTGNYLNPTQYKLAKHIWEKCHLHWRRSVGAKKAAWKRKGYIATYGEVPDFRDPKWHKGKLVYDMSEL